MKSVLGYINSERSKLLFAGLFILSLFIPNDLIKNSAILLLGLYGISRSGGLQRFTGFFSQPVGWLLIGYFLMNVAGMIHTDNIKAGMKVLEFRSAFLVLPIVVYLLNPSKKTVFRILLLFAFGTLAFALAGLLYRVWFYFNEVQDTGYFYSDNMVTMFGFQAVYYAVYVNFAVFILLHHLFENHAQVRIPKTVTILSVALLIGISFLLASRLSMLSLYLMLAIYLVIYIFRKKQFLLGGGLFLAGALMVVAMVTFFPKTLKRFESIKNTKFDFSNTRTINHFNAEIDERNWNGLNTRRAIWTCAIEAIEEQPLLGAGTGDFIDALHERYTANNFLFGLKRNYNCHNMYLQTTLMLGITGLILFLTFLAIPLAIAIRNKAYLYIVFLVFILLAMLTEDFFSRNRGIILFAFFNSMYLLWIVSKKKEENLPETEDDDDYLLSS